jgi:hypothetical protein
MLIFKHLSGRRIQSLPHYWPCLNQAKQPTNGIAALSQPLVGLALCGRLTSNARASQTETVLVNEDATPLEISETLFGRIASELPLLAGPSRRQSRATFSSASHGAAGSARRALLTIRL